MPSFGLIDLTKGSTQVINRKIQDRILMQNMKFHSHVGVLPSEKACGQTFELDLVLYCGHLRATETDLLSQTVNYAEVYTLIADVMKHASFDLIERLAGYLADEILRHHRLVQAIEIIVRKPEAPIEGEVSAMAVQIYRERD